MDSFQLPNQSEKGKKISLFKTILSGEKFDKVKIREHFLENHSSIPQEYRLFVYNLMFDLHSNNRSDNILKNHYDYMRSVAQKVLLLKSNNNEELNYGIYLLDHNMYPLFDTGEMFEDGQEFFLIFKQMTDILDDANEFETYYLTAKLYDDLKENLNEMKDKFYSYFQKDSHSKPYLNQIDIDRFFLTGLGGIFPNIRMYHILWDRLSMNEYDLLIYTIIVIIENCKEEHLKFLNDPMCTKDLLQKLGLNDEAKILKTAIKFYRNSSIQHLITNYFNSK